MHLNHRNYVLTFYLSYFKTLEKIIRYCRPMGIKFCEPLIKPKSDIKIKSDIPHP